MSNIAKAVIGALLAATMSVNLAGAASTRQYHKSAPSAERTQVGFYSSWKSELPLGWRKRHDRANAGARNRRVRAGLARHRRPIQWHNGLLRTIDGRNWHLLYIQFIVSRTRQICGPYESQFRPIRGGCCLYD